MKHFRKARSDDSGAIEALYRAAVSRPSGLARNSDEISDGFGHQLVTKLLDEGLVLIAETKPDPTEPARLIGLIHGSFNAIGDLRHVMNQVTIVIHPQWQGRGWGKRLFQEFLHTIIREHSHIYRVELRTRASNVAGRKLYHSLGFVIEGRFRGRIRGSDGRLEDGYPMVWFNPEWCDLRPRPNEGLLDL